MAYEIADTTIGELREGDQVLGTDGKWHNIKILNTELLPMYRIVTEAGCVNASYNHRWAIFEEVEVNGKPIKDRYEYSSVELFGQLDKFRGSNIGLEDGPRLLDVISLGEAECRCIEVLDSEDHQFEIITDDGLGLFTRNCGGRLVCGRISAIASQMALGNSLGTVIDGSHKGAGIASINNISTSLQYYFENTSWIDDWYSKHGMDNKGYPLDSPNRALSPEDIHLGEDEEEFSISDSDQTFTFEDSSKDVINRKEQKFMNI